MDTEALEGRQGEQGDAGQISGNVPDGGAARKERITVPMALEVPQELEERISFWSDETHETPDVLMLRAIERYLEDLEDYADAVEVSREIRAGQMKTYSLEEVEREMDELDRMED